MTYKSLVAVLFISSTAAFAEDFPADGTGFGTSSSTPMPVSETLTVVNVLSNYDGFEAADPTNPMADLTGTCFGAIMIDAGAVSGGGNCLYKDKAGESVVMHWIPEGITAEGHTTGSWSVAGGTGTWAEASGGGAFDAGTDASGAYSNKITGTISMP